MFLPANVSRITTIREMFNRHRKNGAANFAKAQSSFVPFASYPFHQYSNEVFQCGCDISSQPDKSTEIDLIRCQQCGTYFPKRIFSPFATNLCDECLKKSQEDYRNDRD